MTQMLELSDNDFKALVTKMLEQEITKTLETTGKKKKKKVLAKKQKVLAKKTQMKNFWIQKYNNQPFPQLRLGAQSSQRS